MIIAFVNRLVWSVIAAALTTFLAYLIHRAATQSNQTENSLQ